MMPTDNTTPQPASSDVRPLVTSKSPEGVISTELSARRTGMSFQRTRMSADRTLMSVIRTALSLIGFGFTIFQFFKKLQQSDVLANSHAARHFGEALVLLGITMLTLGIIYHLSFMRELRKTRDEMTSTGLIHGQSQFPPSLTLVTAVLLLAIGFSAILHMAFGFGPLD
jgi:putative membrane protein